MLELNSGVDITKAKESFITAYYNGYTEAVALEEAQKGESTLFEEQVAMAYNAGKAFADAGGKFSAGVQAIVDGSVAEAKNDASEVESSDSISEVRKRFNTQLEKWDRKTAGFSFTLGTTSSALKQAGIPDKQIRWDATKIITLLEKHGGMSIDIIKQIPELLENPVIVIDSKQNDNAKIVMGDLQDENGKTVTVVLLLTPTSSKGNTLDIIKISSAQGRSHIESLFKKEDGTEVPIRYVDKNRIRNWLNVNRLQLPLRSTDSDSTNIIPNSSENVKKGRVVYEDGVEQDKLSQKQKAQIKYIEIVAAVTGVEIHLFQSGLNSEGMYDVPYNGKFNRGNNTIYIDVNAGKQGENIGDYALTRTLSHELTHFIRMNAPREYMALMRFCFQKIGMDKFNTLVESKTANNESLDFEDAIEEVVASGCEMMLKDSRVIEQLARENRSLAEKILDFLKDFAEKVKEAFSGVNAVSYEAKQLEAHADELVKLWDNALKKAIQNNTSAGDTSAMRTQIWKFRLVKTI